MDATIHGGMKESLPAPVKSGAQFCILNTVTIGATAAQLLTRDGVIGKIDGVFDRTVNILTRDNEILTLARIDVGNSPVTIILNLPPDVGITSFDIDNEAEVVKSGSSVYVLGSDVIINLRGATLWRIERPIKIKLTVIEICRNCDIAKNVGVKYGKHGGLADIMAYYDEIVKGDTVNGQELNPFSRHALPRIIALIKAVPDRNIDAVANAVKGLIGLGHGLTPSGDDVLAGFMISLLLVTEAFDGEIAHAREINQTIISMVDGQTTFLSEKSLEYAAQGESPELVYNLLLAIVTGTEEQVESATLALLEVGHFSGTDMLFGILLGFHVALTYLVKTASQKTTMD